MRKIGSNYFFEKNINKNVASKDEKEKNFFQKKDDTEEKNLILQNNRPKNHQREPLIFWQAKEFEQKIRPRFWYLVFFLIIFGLVVYAFLTDNLLMSIIFIIFGFLFYYYEKRVPREYTFGITREGVFAQDSLYEFESLENFWIFYYPRGKKELSLKSRKAFLPYVQIPLGTVDPTKIRDILLKYLPEEEHQKSLYDMVSEIL